jgi:hypothetical protein
MRPRLPLAGGVDAGHAAAAEFFDDFVGADTERGVGGGG